MPFLSLRTPTKHEKRRAFSLRTYQKFLSLPSCGIGFSKVFGSFKFFVEDS